MMTDPGPYFCAKCLAQLDPIPSEEESCPKCDADICCERDFLTEVQWIGRVADDHSLWVRAYADGLFKTKAKP